VQGPGAEVDLAEVHGVPDAGLPRGELEAFAKRLLAENAGLRQAIAELRAEVATLKGLKGRPKVRPSGMEKATV